MPTTSMKIFWEPLAEVGRLVVKIRNVRLSILSPLRSFKRNDLSSPGTLWVFFDGMASGSFAIESRITERSKKPHNWGTLDNRKEALFKFDFVPFWPFVGIWSASIPKTSGYLCGLGVLPL